MQITGFFVIRMQLIAEPCYNEHFHNENIYQVPTGFVMVRIHHFSMSYHYRNMLVGFIIPHACWL